MGGSDQIYACYETPEAKGGNYNGYCNEDVTAALQTLNVTSDYDAQTDLLNEAEMGIWSDAVTIPIFLYVTLHNLAAGTIAAPARPTRTACELHGVILTVWYCASVVLITQRFWDYWVSLV